jgi:hypothetical protein
MCINSLTVLSSILATLNPTDNLYTVVSNQSDIAKSVSTIRRYTTANFDDNLDCVNFWCCVLGHSDAGIMINVSRSTRGLWIPILNLLQQIFARFFRQQILLKNLQSKHPPVVPVVDDTPGSTFEFDYKWKWTDSKGQLTRTFHCCWLCLRV